MSMAFVAALAMSTLAAGESKLEPQTGGERPPGFADSDLPGMSSEGMRALAELGARAERAQANREEWLMSPAGQAEREESRTAFADATAVDSLALFEREFPGLLERAAGDPADVAASGDIAGFVDDFTMRIDPPGTARDALVESTVALRAENEHGIKAPVDLSLSPIGAGFAPTNPLVDVSLPARLEDGAQVGGVGVFVDAAAAEPYDGRLLQGTG